MHKSRFLIILVIIALLFTSCSLYSTFNIDKSKLNSVQTDKTELQIDTSKETAEFHFIDVGQGDCILVQSGETNILIDAGTTQSGHIVYNYLTELGIDSLDYFIGTHPHEDHLGGAKSVLSSIDSKTVFLNSDTSTSYFYEGFVDTLIDKEITPVIPDMDCIYKLGPFRIKFLSPNKDFENANNNSLVVMIQFGDVKALFTGDCERAVEAELIKNNVDISADILKVGHHGSRYASSAEFLNSVCPGVAVIQCGEGNSYGHPHKEALERLSKIGAETLRTDEEGNIILVTDGKIVQKTTGEIYEKQKETPEITLEYIGNRKSKVFHTESCPNLPGESNRINFASREDAINRGFKKCGNCNP